MTDTMLAEPAANETAVPDADAPAWPSHIFLATFMHQGGTDASAFKTVAAALAWRDEIATTFWDEEFPGTPKPTDTIGERYFAAMEERDEYFDVESLEVRG